MSLFGSIARLGSSAMRIAAPIVRNPIVKVGASFVPGLSTVASLASIGSTAYDAFASRPASSAMTLSPAGLPALPMGGALPALPMLSGAANHTVVTTNGTVIPGNVQDSANIIHTQNLRVSHRAPKGFVVVWDGGMRGVGNPYGVPKATARNMRYRDGSRVMQPHHKPPISVGQWNSLKRSAGVIKKLHKVEKEARKIAGYANRGHHKATLAIAHHKKAK